MGRILSQVKIRNFAEPSKELQFAALVDTGATLLTLPMSWKERLGAFGNSRQVEMEIATQHRVEAEVCGPVLIQLEGFPLIASEVCFLEMQPENGGPEALIGYIALEQSGAAVDMVGQRLIRLPHFDMK